jgi:hypothetical protein
MKHLVDKVMTEKVDFMGDTVEVKKLSVAQVFEIQELSKSAAKAKDQEMAQMSLLMQVLKIAVIGAEEISEKEFNNFPLNELTKLSEKVMSISGLGDGAQEAGNLA